MTSKKPVAKKKPTAGERIAASLREAAEWAAGNDDSARFSKVEVPTVDIRDLRKRLGLSQAAFAAKFGFQPATVRNWEQGRTRPDGPARTLLAVIARHPDAVEDALRQAS